MSITCQTHYAPKKNFSIIFSKQRRKNLLYRDAVRALVVRSSDASNTTVGSHDQDGSHGRLQRAVEKRETLDVQHVDLVNEQHARHNLRLALLAPLRHLGINLLTNLGLDFTSITYRDEDKRRWVSLADGRGQRTGLSVHQFFFSSSFPYRKRGQGNPACGC